MHFHSSQLSQIVHETKVNITTNIGAKAACPFNNTCCHEDCVVGDDCPAKGWGCCPTPGATCCEDKIHCCPDFLPVCDVAGQMCKPKGGGMLGALPFTHPMLTKGLNRTRVQPVAHPIGTHSDAGNETYARCEGNEDNPKCVPCAKGSTHDCMLASECLRQCQVHYKCEAKHADGGGWNWMCVEQPFKAGSDEGMTKDECDMQCTDAAQDRFGCEVTGTTVSDAKYTCNLLKPVFDPSTGYGRPNPAGVDNATCSGADPYAPQGVCQPTYSCTQTPASPGQFSYNCTELPPAAGKPNPAGQPQSRCSEMCAKRYTCDYAADYTCKECDPCEGQPKGACKPEMGPETCTNMLEQCQGTDFSPGVCQPSYSCEITHTKPDFDTLTGAIPDFQYKCIELEPGDTMGHYKKDCEEQCAKRYECSFLDDYKCVEVAPEPAVGGGGGGGGGPPQPPGYPTAGAPFLDCAQQCVKPCAFNGEFNLTSKMTNSTTEVVLRDVVSPAPDSYFSELKNPGGEPCYEITHGNGVPNTDSAPGVMANDDPRLDLPVHIDEEIAMINSDPSLPWTAGRYSMWEGKTRRDARSRYGTIMSAPPHLARLPVQLKSAASADFVAPTSFDARDKWPDCPSIGTIRNQGGCGSCWAFAATETLEDRFCIAGASVGGTGGCTSMDELTGEVKSDGCLSPEYITDCDHHDGGCQGGFLDNAWRFMKEFGVPLESCHPYANCAYPPFPNCTAPKAPKSAKFECAAGKGCVPSNDGTMNMTECEKTCALQPRSLPAIQQMLSVSHTRSRASTFDHRSLRAGMRADVR
jgi:hypothetical protein